ncbi:MAG: hypothetical protein QW273_00435 [Candidatus Pacearchaeota archaeon]
MKYKKFIFYLVVSSFLFSFISAVSYSVPSFCCERSKDGGICLNLEKEKCDLRYQTAPTSCEQTSFCKLGTCYDMKEGLCLENVPQKVCMEKNGSWSEKKPSELPQCQLGCCIIGEQAAFVSALRCKRLSTYYGIEMEYRKDVTSESDCILLANSQDIGACVTFKETGINECKLTTRKECGAKEGVISLNVNKSIAESETGKRFYPGILCSAPELNTECARQVKTGCYQGKVYWFDSCGNRENVYSSDREKSWNRGRIASPDEICERVSSNSKDCGNCDYLLGTTCTKWEGVFGIGKPTFGDYFCKKTTCKDLEGNTRLNGESWCVYDIEPGRGYEKVGSRHFRQICLDGEVITDPCEDYRNQICVHSGIPTTKGEFSTAACRPNRWADCLLQTRKKDCENIDKRDCIWTNKIEGLKLDPKNTQSNYLNPFNNPTSLSNFNNAQQAANIFQASQLFGGLTGRASVSLNNGLNVILSSGRGMWEPDFELLNKVTKFNKSEEEEGGICLPLIPPGNKFWEGQGSCSLASAVCDVTIKRIERYEGLLAGADAKKVYDYQIINSDGIEVESECLKWEGGKAPKGTSSKSYSLVPNPEWAIKANAICTSIGDCGANVNINNKYTDNGYIWRFRNSTFSLLGNIKKGLETKGTGYSILESEKILLNNNISIPLTNFVLTKPSENNYKIKKAEELRVGDVIVDSDGEEILILSISKSEIKNDKPFFRSLLEKIGGYQGERILGEGNSPVGLSLGEYGTGIKIMEKNNE